MMLYIWRGASEAHACGVSVAFMVHVICLLIKFTFSMYKCFRFRINKLELMPYYLSTETTRDGPTVRPMLVLPGFPAISAQL